MNKNHKEQLSEVVYLPDAQTYFTDETIQGLRELGAVLAGIRTRLKSEGYVKKDGKMTKEDIIQL